MAWGAMVGLRRAQWWYAGVVAVLLLAYAATTAWAWSGRGWSEQGSLAYAKSAAPSVSAAEIHVCRGQSDDLNASGDAVRLKFVAGQVAGAPYLACYGVDSFGGVTGAVVLTEVGLRPVSEPRILQAGGVWPQVAVVSSPGQIVFGGLVVALLSGLYLLYYRRPLAPAPTRPWWATRWVDVPLALSGIGLLLLWAIPGRSIGRKARVSTQALFGWTAFAFAVVDINALGRPDAVALSVVGFLTASQLAFWAAARILIAPRAALTAVAGPVARRPQAPVATERWTVRPPAELPSFSHVGGMAALKAELGETVGALLVHGTAAAQYRVQFNGILLHGRPGTGKTWFAQALAGEFGLNFLRVTAGDVVSRYAGEAVRAVDEVFAHARAHAPCVLFFDEFDSLAARRDQEPDAEHRRVVNQLLTALAQHRGNRQLIVVAATNDVSRLDPAVTRTGRFDRVVRIDLPDGEARRAILAAALAGRPYDPAADLVALATATDGRTAAELAGFVDTAARAAFLEHTATGAPTPITDRHLHAAVQAHQGEDRPTLGEHPWESLVLPDALLRELQTIQRLIEDPTSAAAFGLQPQTGMLLAGPPGTGKTSIARTLAAQTRASFYPLTTADLTSPWVGQAEQQVTQLFERARAGAPSIVFIDEVDAIASHRDGPGGGSLHEQLLSQLLAEIDGIAGSAGRGARVFVLAATNRPHAVDPALLRGGRLSRTVHLALPGPEDRLRMLTLHARGVPLAADADLAALAAATEGHSGADLAALVQQAALRAFSRHTGSTPLVTEEDLTAALAQLPRAREAARPPAPADPRLHFARTRYGR